MLRQNSLGAATLTVHVGIGRWTTVSDIAAENFSRTALAHRAATHSSCTACIVGQGGCRQDIFTSIEGPCDSRDPQQWLCRAMQGDENAAKKFQEVSKAYDTLRDPQKRQQYDSMGADGYERMAENGGAGWSPVHYFNPVVEESTCFYM